MDKPAIIYSSDAVRAGRDASRLAFLAKRGKLVRIRHGAYLPAEQWAQLSEREKYGLRAEAMSRFTASEPVFCAQSAGLLWGFPLLQIPSNLHVLSNSSKHGRSRKGVTAHNGPLLGNITDISRFQTTDKIRTAVELCTRLPFAEALGIADAARRESKESAAASWSEWTRTSPRGHSVSLQALQAMAQSLPTSAARRSAETVIGLSSTDAGSLGESISRAQIYLAKFPMPVLQQAFTLANGRTVWTDFFWKEFDLVGEFDGKEKYFRRDWGNGKSPGDRVFAEKRREDGLRALGLRVVRWTWADAINPSRLRKCLMDAGLSPSDAADFG